MIGEDLGTGHGSEKLAEDIEIALSVADELVKTTVLNLIEDISKNYQLAEFKDLMKLALQEAEEKYLKISPNDSSTRSFFDFFSWTFLTKIESLAAENFQEERYTKIAGLFHIIVDMAEKNLQQQKKSGVDHLTKLSDRRKLEEDFKKFLEQRRSTDSEDFSIIVLDIDHFKKVNDTLGHLAGDIVLQSLAKTLNNLCRVSDKIYRYGGEEFLIIANGTKEEVRKLMDRILNYFRENSITSEGAGDLVVEGLRDLSVDIKVSMGRVFSKDIPKEDWEQNTLFDMADKALYRAKNSGRDKIVESSEM